jgi:hypothetical protein
MFAKNSGTDYEFKFLAPSNYVFTMGFGGNSYAPTTTTYNDRYYFYGATYDSAAGSNQIQYYLNNLSAGQATKTGAIGTSTAALCIGNRPVGDLPLNSTFCYLMIYNKPLTPTEINQTFDYVNAQMNNRGVYLYNVSHSPATINVNSYGWGYSYSNYHVLSGATKTMSAGDTLYFPAGTYRYYLDTNTFPIPANSIIKGDGIDQSIIKLPDNTDISSESENKMGNS